MAVHVAVHHPSPDRTLAVSLDSASDLSCTDSTQAHYVDVDHQPTDLAVGFESLAAVNDSPEIRIVYAGIDPVTGRRRQVTRQVKGKREAERLEAKLRAAAADGRHRRTSARTVAELLDVYLAWRETSGKPLSPATLNDYRTIVEAKLKPALASCGSPSSTRSPWTASTASSTAGAATTRPRSSPAGSARSTPCCRVPWAWPPATGGSASTRPGSPGPSCR
jgi:hypothetical protein